MNEILMKKVADSYEAVPPGFVWENIELSLNENKKRRHFFFLVNCWNYTCFKPFSIIVFIGNLWNQIRLPKTIL